MKALFISLSLILTSGLAYSAVPPEKDWTPPPPPPLTPESSLKLRGQRLIPSLLVGEGPNACAIQLSPELLSQHDIKLKEIQEALIPPSENSANIKADLSGSFKLCSDKTAHTVLSGALLPSRPLQTAGPLVGIFAGYYGGCTMMQVGMDRVNFDFNNPAAKKSSIMGILLLTAVCIPVAGVNKLLRWGAIGDDRGRTPYYNRKK